MPSIIKDKAIVDDNWIEISPEATFEIPANARQIIVDLSTWQAHKAELMAASDLEIGLKLLGEDEPETFSSDLAHFALICIEFPAFTDGRGYSLARMLRERYDYQGELRATGDVLRDQLFFLSRVGFNAFKIREDRSTEDALASLQDFSVSYQAAQDQPKPIYRR